MDINLQVQNKLNLLFGWIGELTAVDLAVAAAIPFLAWVFRRWIARLSISTVAWVLTQFGLTVGPKFREKVRPAVTALFVSVGVYLGIMSLGIPPYAELTLVLLLRTLIAILVFWLINQSVQLLLDHRVKSKAAQELQYSAWVKQIMLLFIVVLMLVVILKIWGIDLGPALTGLGIAGAAVALASQDLIRNLIAGFNNVGEQRFRLGDWVKVNNDLEGTIEAMHLRTTVIRRFDHGTMHVPNSELANAPLVNFSQRDARRIFWEISLTYGTDQVTLEKICDQVRTYIQQSGFFVVRPDVNLFVQLFSFEHSSINLLIDCFVASNVRQKELEARHALIVEVKRIVEEAGVQFAFPTQTIYTHDAEGSVA